MRQYLIATIVILTLVCGGLGYTLYEKHSELNELKDELDSTSRTLASTRSRATKAASCHEEANSMALRAEELILDLYQYGDDSQFYFDIQKWVSDAEVYNQDCVYASYEG